MVFTVASVTGTSQVTELEGSAEAAKAARRHPVGGNVAPPPQGHPPTLGLSPKCPLWNICGWLSQMRSSDCASCAKVVLRARGGAPVCSLFLVLFADCWNVLARRLMLIGG